MCSYEVKVFEINKSGLEPLSLEMERTLRLDKFKYNLEVIFSPTSAEK